MNNYCCSSTHFWILNHLSSPLFPIRCFEAIHKSLVFLCKTLSEIQSILTGNAQGQTITS